MDDQLATSSCLVGSMGRFLDITENQNSDSQSLSSESPPNAVTPERKPTLKRRSNEAKLRLSQVNRESVGVIQQRVEHRDESVRKIQQVWKEFSCRVQSRSREVDRSKMKIHYQVLTHLLTLKHTRKCMAVRLIQSWWRCQRARHRVARLSKITLRGKWSFQLSQKVQALLRGYRVRRVLTNSEKYPIKTAVMLLINANDVLEGICDDINTEPTVIRNILALNSKRIMTRGLLIYCCVHRQELVLNGKRASLCSKGGNALHEDFVAYGKYFSQLPIEWAFVENFVRQILYNRTVISNYFSSIGELSPKSAQKEFQKNVLPLPPTIHSPHTKENHKHLSNSSTKVSHPHEKTATKSPGSVSESNTITKKGAETANRETSKKPLVPRSLKAFMTTSAVQGRGNETHIADEQTLGQSGASIAISPLQSSPLSKCDWNDQPSTTSLSAPRETLSPKRTARVIPSSLCSPSPSDRIKSNEAPSSSPVVMNSTPVMRPQYSTKPHLQIDVVCANNLGTVTAARKARNQMIRKPSVKVSVCLPSAGGSEVDNNDHDVAHGGALKVVHTATYVSPSEISPTDPVWNFTTYCPLRVPTSFASCSSDEGFVDYDNIMSTYWSQGAVKIEIIDSERFNEDIYLGEVTLFLSNFLLQKPTSNSSNTSYREIKGNFSTVNNPKHVSSTSNNNSGSCGQISASVYIHFPGITATTSVSDISNSIQQSRSVSKSTRRPTYPLARKSLQNSDVDTSPPIPKAKMKSALSHIPSPGCGGLTASARRQQRQSIGSSLEMTSTTIRKDQVTPTHNPTTPDEGRDSSARSISCDSGGHRRQSLENVSTILNFLEDALQEEAEATVESLKQNYVSSMEKKRRKSLDLGAPLSNSPLSKPSNDGTPLSKCHSAADNVDLDDVQNDLDDIMGALSRSRILAKNRPL